MHYFLVVFNMFQPLVEAPLGSCEVGGPLGEVPLSDAGIFNGKTAREVLVDAQTHYETIVRLYYLRHGFEGMDSFLVPILSTLAFETNQEIKLVQDGDQRANEDKSHI